MDTEEEKLYYKSSKSLSLMLDKKMLDDGSTLDNPFLNGEKMHINSHAPGGIFWIKKKNFIKPPLQGIAVPYGAWNITIDISGLTLNLKPIGLGYPSFSNPLSEFFPLGNVNVRAKFEVIDYTLNSFGLVDSYTVKIDYDFPFEKFEDVPDLINAFDTNFEFPGGKVYDIDFSWSETYTY